MNATPNDIGRDLPHNSDAELALLACCLIDAEATDNTIEKARAEGISRADFYSHPNELIFDAIVRIQKNSPPATEALVASDLRERGELERVGGIAYIAGLTAAAPTTAHAKRYIADVKKCARLRRFINAAQHAAEAAGLPNADPQEISAVLRSAVEHVEVDGTAAIMERMEARRITAAHVPAEPVPIFYLAGKPIATRGNLSSLIAKAKTGKTASIGGIVASAVAAAAVRTGLDTLGFTASNPEGKALIVLDTEQSTFDAHQCVIIRAVGRAGEKADPPWLYAYSLAGMAAGELRSVLPSLLATISRKHGGIFAVILDGGADFVSDVNDPKECNAFVAELHGLAITHDCHIMSVIHSNEGQRTGDDGRGHLGKQLTRKAESNLLLKKEGDVTTITSEKQRKAPITAADGVAFKWSDEEGRHVSCGSPAKFKDEEKKGALSDLAAEVFGTDSNLQWSELERRIGAARNLKGNTPGRRIDEMKRLRVIKIGLLGRYERVA